MDNRLNSEHIHTFHFVLINNTHVQLKLLFRFKESIKMMPVDNMDPNVLSKLIIFVNNYLWYDQFVTYLDFIDSDVVLMHQKCITTLLIR